MSGHCPGRGLYHEEDDGRECARCKARSAPVRQRVVKIVSQMVPVCGGVSIAQKSALTDAVTRLVAEEAWKAHMLGRDWATEYLHCKYDAAMTARDRMVATYGPRPAGEPNS